jgi:hypothetical protein
VGCQEAHKSHSLTAKHEAIPNIHWLSLSPPLQLLQLLLLLLAVLLVLPLILLGRSVRSVV